MRRQAPHTPVLTAALLAVFVLAFIPWLLPVQAADSRKFALVIGIGEGYRHRAFQTLRYPEQDARNMAESLQKLGFEVIRVIGGEATAAGIKYGFDQIAQRADHPSDLVIIYYSGHGAIQKAVNRDIPSLVPAEADPDRPTSFISDTELGTWLGFIHSRRIWLILDSCYSAGIGGGDSKRITSPEQISPQEIQARLQRIQQAEFAGALFQSTVILASSQAREVSKEMGRKGGLFTYFLLQGLGEEGRNLCPACVAGTNAVTPQSWLEYAAQGVADHVDQKPQLREPASGEQLALLIPWVRPLPGATIRPRATPTSAATPLPTPAPTPEPTPAPTPLALPSPTPAPAPAPPPEPRPGTIVIRLNVSGADVAVNGSVVQTGVGPEVRLEDQAPGAYNIEISKEGYLPRTLTVTVHEGERMRLVANLSKRPEPKGLLTITTDPPGAKVLIGNKTYTSPVTGLSLRPGSYAVAISRGGYQGLQEQVLVEAEKENRYTYQLMPVIKATPAPMMKATPAPKPFPIVHHTPRPTPTPVPVARYTPRPTPIPTQPSTGELTIITYPPRAEVTIEGQTYISPVTVQSLRPGKYYVQVSRRGYEKREQWVEVNSQQENKYTFRLHPEAPPTPEPTPEPTPNAAFEHFRRGKILAGRNMFEEAVAEYKEAIRINPDYDDAYLQLVVILSNNLNRNEEALQAARAFVRLDPNDKGDVGYWNLGVVLGKLDRWGQAIQAYKLYLKHNPNGRFAEKAQKSIDHMSDVCARGGGGFLFGLGAHDCSTDPALDQ